MEAQSRVELLQKLRRSWLRSGFAGVVGAGALLELGAWGRGRCRSWVSGAGSWEPGAGNRSWLLESGA